GTARRWRRLFACALYTLPRSGASGSRGLVAPAASLYLKPEPIPDRYRQERSRMATFKEREKGFEGKFAHDQEMQFKAAARGSRLFGLWAAGLLGKTSDDATAYAIEVVKSDLTAAGHEDVIAK